MLQALPLHQEASAEVRLLQYHGKQCALDNRDPAPRLLNPSSSPFLVLRPACASGMFMPCRQPFLIGHGLL